MALSANSNVRTKTPPQRETYKVTSGLIRIYQGALLNFVATGGYVKLGSDTLSEKFAGIATEEVNVTAADNVTPGTFEVEVIPAGNDEHVELTLSAAATFEAALGNKVYVGGDDVVKLSATNTTGGQVGVIRQWISATKVFVDLDS